MISGLKTSSIRVSRKIKYDLNSKLITHPNNKYDHDILNISQTRYTRQEQVVTLHYSVDLKVK